ncbi:MAG: ATP-binding cassette domain-containing protein, partial [Afipia sp.]
MMTSTDASQVILRTTGVSKSFGKFVALNNISAEFSRNAITSIIGPNGAGKSTYFNLLSGAFP